MPSKISMLALVALGAVSVSAQDLQGTALNYFNSSGCDTNGYYSTVYLGPANTCTTVYSSDPNYNTTPGGGYETWWSVPAPPSGCQIMINSQEAVDDPKCGNAIAIFTQTSCTMVDIPTAFGYSWCCGDDCNLGTSRRSVSAGELEEPAKLATKSKLEKRAELAKAAKKRDTGNCAWSGNSPYTSVGAQQQITNVQNCPVGADCTTQEQHSVTTESTNSFGVSESAEVGLFDIVQSTTTFSYDYSYSDSHSESVTISYTIPQGGSGYVTWTPTLQCTDGSFDGSDCDGNGYPTGSSGTVCIPETLDNSVDGEPRGETTVVQVN